MKAQIVFAKEFRTDLYAQIERLVSGGREAWAERLLEEIEAAARLLASAPPAGPVDLHRDNHEFRRLLLQRTPLIIRYSFQPRSRKVVVLRLFHARQRRK